MWGFIPGGAVIGTAKALAGKRSKRRNSSLVPSDSVMIFLMTTISVMMLLSIIL
jgi:hypothetical protein